MGATEVRYLMNAIKRDVKALNFRGAAEKLTALKNMTENPVLQAEIDQIIKNMKARESEIEKDLANLEVSLSGA